MIRTLGVLATSLALAACSAGDTSPVDAAIPPDLTMCTGADSPITYVGGSANATIDLGFKVNLSSVMGVRAGDLLLAMIQTSGDSTAPDLTVPAGFTLVRTDATGSVQQRLYTKIATASEPGNYEWPGTDLRAAGVLLAYRHASATMPIVVGNADINGMGAATADKVITAPSLASEGCGRLLVDFYSAWYGGTIKKGPQITVPGGETVRQQVSGPNGAAVNAYVLAAGDQTIAMPGDTGSRTANITVTCTNCDSEKMTTSVLLLPE